MSNAAVQETLPSQINLVDVCLNKKNVLHEVTMCVEVKLKDRNSHVRFQPSGTWLLDAVSALDPSLKLGAYLPNRATPIMISSSIDRSEWTLEGKYYFQDNTPVAKPKPKTKTKAKAKPKAKSKPKAQPQVTNPESTESTSTSTVKTEASAKSTPTRTSRRSRATSTTSTRVPVAPKEERD